MHSARSHLHTQHKQSGNPSNEAPRNGTSVDGGLLERRYTIAAQYDAQGVCIFDADQRLLHANNRYSEIYGLDPAEISIGMSLHDILTLRIEKGIYGNNGPEAYKRERMRHVTRRKTRIQDLIDGRSILIVQQPTTNGHWITTHEDITERLRTEAEVAFRATCDPLTGLANRASLTTHIENAFRDLEPAKALCVFLIDLDHFKPVNDTWGHDIGDAVLKVAAKRIRASVRDTDVVARFGGDEFVVTQYPMGTRQQTERIVQRLIDALTAPIATNAGEISIGATVGLASAHRNETTPAGLLKKADIALYAAKSAGRGTFRFFDPSQPKPVSPNENAAAEDSTIPRKEK